MPYDAATPAESHAPARSEPMTTGTGAKWPGAATLGTEFSTGGFTVTHLNRSNFGPPLIALGGALLATRVLEFGILEFPFLSIVLVVIGTLRRESAWFIPGGILAGIGLGGYLSEASFLSSSLTEEAATGVFLLSFALGWVGVFALSERLGDVPNTWALVPAIVMSVIGTLLLSAGSGERVLTAISYAWPLGLVAAGAVLVLKTQTTHD